VLGRVGILMLGSPALLIPGIILVSIASALQVGATGAVKTVKMTAKLLTPDPHRPHDATPQRPQAPTEVAATVREEAEPASRPSPQQPGT
jgi:predicted lipid-binding transport protein (Tim44 family)